MSRLFVIKIAALLKDYDGGDDVEGDLRRWLQAQYSVDTVIDVEMTPAHVEEEAHHDR